MYRLRKKDINSLLGSWIKHAQVFTPQIEAGQVMLLPYEESKFTMDYINFSFPVKEYLFKQKETLFSWSNNNGNIKVEAQTNVKAEEKIYFGIRACDVYAIRYMDKFFLEGYRDELYGRNRDAATIVAVNCTKVEENCFCASTGTGPFADSGYDLLLTPLQDSYLVEAGTAKGKALIASSVAFLTEVEEDVLNEKESVNKATVRQFKRSFDLENVSLLLEKSFNNSIWQELSKQCISCTGCTSVCPTCTCFNVVEENKGSNSGCRVRRWDSCQSDSFTRNAKEHNPRSSEARFRYRIYDKFKYIEDRFGMKGCTGCGRCAGVCPASINIIEVINKLSDCDVDILDNGGK